VYFKNFFISHSPGVLSSTFSALSIINAWYGIFRGNEGRGDNQFNILNGWGRNNLLDLGKNEMEKWILDRSGVVVYMAKDVGGPVGG
jgi:hypothetical protein